MCGSGTVPSGQGHPGQRLQHGALPRALVSYDGDSRQRQVLLHPQRAERVDEVDAGTNLLLILLAQILHVGGNYKLPSQEIFRIFKSFVRVFRSASV